MTKAEIEKWVREHMTLQTALSIKVVRVDHDFSYRKIAELFALKFMHYWKPADNQQAGRVLVNVACEYLKEDWAEEKESTE